MNKYKKVRDKADEFEEKYNELKKQIYILDDLNTEGVGELQFSNICIENLLNALHEIEEKTNDPIVKKLSQIAREKHHLDKIQHARSLFE